MTISLKVIFEGLNPEQLNEVLNNIALLMIRDRI